MENTALFPQKGFIYLTGKINSFISFFISRINRKTIIFYDHEDEALLLKEEIEFFSKKECHVFPLFSDRLFEKDDRIKRTGFLTHLIDDNSFIGLFPYNGITHKLTDKSVIERNTMTLSFGDTFYQEELVDYLDKNGYELVPLVREEGEFAKRGSIIDVFTPASSSPVRIEFLGDEIY
ncbi:MAG TPA: hypothetical protein PLW88_05815, partial [Syntrophorhabdaceae bacterium]|nr:hypothetical protein [Syntrophorhabdaceae bacterium]